MRSGTALANNGISRKRNSELRKMSQIHLTGLAFMHNHLYTVLAQLLRHKYTTVLNLDGLPLGLFS